MSPKENRLEFLDSLRGLASISVVLSHFVFAYRLDLEFKVINFSPFHFFYDGFAAVTFFFVLSGYVLTLSLERAQVLKLGSFYLKRIFRIMPAYLMTLILSFSIYLVYRVRHTIPDTSSWINEFWNRPISLYDLFKQFLFLNSSNRAELVPQSWSLKVEMIFSFLIPFLYIIYKKTNHLFFIVFNLVLYLLFNVPVFILHFSLGIYLALNQSEILDVFSRIKIRFKYLLIMFIMFLYTYRYTLPMYYYYFVRKESPILSAEGVVWVITGMGAFLILIYCLSSLKLQKILNSKILTFVGKISYAVYLTHMFILIAVIPVYLDVINAKGIYNKYIIWFSAVIVLLMITFLVSYFLTNLIEIPCAKLGSSLLKKGESSELNKSYQVNVVEDQNPFIKRY